MANCSLNSMSYPRACVYLVWHIPFNKPNCPGGVIVCGGSSVVIEWISAVFAEIVGQDCKVCSGMPSH